jgi:ribose transport system substrate-binding protein
MRIWASVVLRLSIAVVYVGSMSSCREHRREVAMIARTAAASIWEAAHTGAQEAAAQHGMTMYWNAPQSEDDAQQQAALVDRIAEERYGGLIVAPDQPLALTTSIRRAVSRGVKTVVIVSPLTIPLEENLAYVVNDDEAAGRMAAMRVSEILHGKGSVAVLGVDPESLSELTILHSFEATLEQRFPEVTIVDCRTGSHNQSEAQEIADEEMNTHPDLGALFTLSAVASYGAINSLQSRKSGKTIKLVGFEQSPTLADRVRAGVMDSLIAEDSYEMGRQAMDLLAANREHSMQPENRRLQPTLLTADNIDLPEMKRLIRLEWGVKP